MATFRGLEQKKVDAKSDVLDWIKRDKEGEAPKVEESAAAAAAGESAATTTATENDSIVEKDVVLVDEKPIQKTDAEKVAEEAAEEAANGGTNVDVDSITECLGNAKLSEDSHLYVGEGVTFRHEKLNGIPDSILEAIEKDLQLSKPSPIQLVSIPVTLQSKSIIAQAQTGSGKTLAFSVALLARLDLSINQPQAMVIAPTRELAIQICNECIRPLSGRMSPRPAVEMAISGGDKIARGAKCKSQVIVGTAGKIKDWSSASKKYIDFKTLKILILDEADQMVKSNAFRDDVTVFAGKCRADCQFLFFSATYPDDCKRYCADITPNQLQPLTVQKNNLMVKDIFQVRMKVEPNKKVDMLRDAYELLSVHSSIVFLDTVDEANRVSKMLTDEGYSVSTLHGRIDGTERDAIMDRFRRNETRFLVTTDVLARGVDVPSVSVVVNFTVPRTRANREAPNLPDSELYLHRIGRTGRYGRRGFAITLVETPEDERDLLAIESDYSPDERLTEPREASMEDILALKEQIANSKKVSA